MWNEDVVHIKIKLWLKLSTQKDEHIRYFSTPMMFPYTFKVILTIHIFNFNFTRAKPGNNERVPTYLVITLRAHRLYVNVSLRLTILGLYSFARKSNPQLLSH